MCQQLPNLSSMHLDCQRKASSCFQSIIRYLAMEKDEDSAFKFRERCSWSKCSSANLSIQLRAGWIGKFCVNWETGESQRRRRIPKLAASGQILQIGGNGEAPRRVAGENARSCPRLTLCPGHLLLLPLWSKPESLLGEIQTWLSGKSENTGQSG